MKVRKRPAGIHRSGFGCGAAFVVGLLVFVIVSTVSATIFIFAPQGTSSAPFLTRQANATPWNERDPLNILLLAPGPSIHPIPLTVASYDPTDRRITLLTLPGNLWVTVPGYGGTELAQAYVDGGSRLALLTVQSIIHVPVPYYAAVSSATLRQMIDDLGGITLYLSRSIHVRHPIGGLSYLLLAPGSHHLGGRAAIAYLRTQPEAALQSTQQQLLLALRNEAIRPQTTFQFPDILNSLGGNIRTNFPYDQALSVLHALLTIPRSRVHLVRLETANGTVVGYRASGQGPVLLPNWQKITRLAHRILPAMDVGGAGPVEVLNGSGQSQAAASLAAWLQQAGLPTRYASANSFDYPHTKVILTSGKPAALHLARITAALLQVPLTRESPLPGTSAIRVLIGRDYQDPTQ